MIISGTLSRALAISRHPSTAAIKTCPNLDLRSPNGSSVNLTGTWYGEDHAWLFYVYQSGSCVWWAGGFPTSETSDLFRYDGLGHVTVVFAGTVASDFTVSGEWSVVRDGGTTARHAWGTETFSIEFSGAAGDESIVLRRITQTGGGTVDSTMTRISDQTIPPP